MQLVLKQSEEKEVKKALVKLAASEGVKLTKLAELMGMNYQKFFQKLLAQYIEIEFIEEVVKVLNDHNPGRKIAIFGKEIEIILASSSGQRIKI